MSDLGQVLLATSLGVNDCFGILIPKLFLCGFRTMTGTSKPFRASSTVTVSFSTWGDGQVAWASSKSLNAGWSNNSLPSSPIASCRCARCLRPCLRDGIFFLFFCSISLIVCVGPAAAKRSRASVLCSGRSLCLDCLCLSRALPRSL